MLFSALATTLCLVISLVSAESAQLDTRALKVPVYDTCKKPNTFALTFDDGPFDYGASLLSTLKKSKAKATFFVNGNNYDCIYNDGPVAQLKARFAQGHLLANHGWGHIHSNEANYDQLHNQLWLVEQAFIKILGVKPVWFRAPYGEYNDLLRRVLAERGYKGLVMWSAESHDADDEPPSASSIINMYKKLPAKSLVLNHETIKRTVYNVMPKVIPALKSRGFKLVTTTECLGISSDPEDWYVPVENTNGHKTGVRDSSWTCAGTPAPGEIA